MSNETFHSVVIGGGQAGLAAGHHLTTQIKKFVILEEQSRTPDARHNHFSF